MTAHLAMVNYSDIPILLVEGVILASSVTKNTITSHSDIVCIRR